MTLVDNPTHRNESEFSHVFVLTLSLYFNGKREFKSMPGVIMMPKQPIQIHRSATVKATRSIASNGLQQLFSCYKHRFNPAHIFKTC